MTPQTRTVALALMLTMLPLAAHAQLLQDENRKREQTNAWAMSVLGTWAVANIAVGLGGWATTERDQLRNFHLMNAGWNVVNLAIAVPSLVSAVRADPASNDLWKALRAGNSIRTALLVNAALDVAYMAFGGYLIARGELDDDARMRGFGQSLILQGGFLFAFDLTTWAAHAVRHGRFMRQVQSSAPGALFP